jgi:hypothetical protein
VETGTAADVEEVRSRPRPDLPHGLLDHPVGIDGAVLDLVHRRRPPDVGAGLSASRDPPHRYDDQMRTTPSAVAKLAATMPGVPFGAVHCTSTPPIDSIDGVPTHSATRLASPAISSFSRLSLPLA